MRLEDAEECRAAGGYSPMQAAMLCLQTATYARTLLISDAPVAFWGTNAVPGVPGVGGIWLLGTTGLLRHRRAFVRHCNRAALAPMLDQYHTLVNFVDARYTEAVRWVRWLGFTVLPAIPYGPFNLLFHPIVIRR